MTLNMNTSQQHKFLNASVIHSVLPESARWLLSKGRYEEANEIIQKVARVNKVEVQSSLINDELVINNEKQELPQEGFLSICKSKTMTNYTLIICFNW